MPKIQIDRLSQGIQLPSTTGQPRASAAGTEISGAAGAALSRQGDLLQTIGNRQMEKIKVARDNEYVSSAMVDSGEQIARFEEQFKQDSLENPAGYTDAFIGEVDDIYDNLIKNAPSQEAKNRLMQIFSSQRVGRFNSALDFEQKTTIDNFYRSSEENLDMILNKVNRDPSNIDSAREEISELSKLAEGVVGSSVAKRFQEAAEDRLALTEISALTRVNPTEALEKLDSGELDSVLDSRKQDAVRKSALKTIQNAQDARDKMIAEEHEAFINNIELSIFKGSDDVDQMYLEGLLENKSISSDEYISLAKKYNRSVDNKAQITSSVDFIKRAGEQNISLSPADTVHKKALDNHYTSVFIPSLEGKSVDEQISAKVNYVNRYKMMPESLKTDLSARISSGDNATKLTAAKELVEYSKESPFMLTGFTRKEIAFATAADRANINGLSEEDAVNAAMSETFQKGTAQRDARIDVYKEADVQFNEDQYVDGIFTIGKPDEVPETMRLEWEDNVFDLIVNLGYDKDVAVRTANTLLTQNWGTSEVNGRPEYMKYPPEKFYGREGEDNSWIREQLIEDTLSIASSGETIESDNIELIHDPRSSKSNPMYFVGIDRDKNGLVSDIELISNDSGPMRWMPDIRRVKGVAESEVQSGQRGSQTLKNKIDLPSVDSTEEKIEDLETEMMQNRLLL